MERNRRIKKVITLKTQGSHLLQILLFRHRLVRLYARRNAVRKPLS
jgi:hypothetical protein